jgi:hypothetical protein
VSGVQYTTSDSLFGDWDVVNTTFLDQIGFAAEVVDAGGHTWYSRVRGVHLPDSTVGRGAQIDTLFLDSGEPAIGQLNRLWDDWVRVAGSTAFQYQPTFLDRPAARTGIPSNVQGHFWINTAEVYAEPVAGGCWECPPDETLTGLLHSRVFTVEGDSLELWVGGGNDPEQLYVALRRAFGHQIVFSETGEGGDAMTRRVWDLTGLWGRDVYIEIADLSMTGHINADAFREFEQGAAGVQEGTAPPSPGYLRATPNPARLPTVSYALRESAAVKLAIYDVQGREIRRLVDGVQEPGHHERQWDGRLASGVEAPSGVYYLRLTAGELTRTASLIRMR